MLLEGKHEVEQLSQTKSKSEENWAPLMLQPPRYPRGCPPRRSHLSIWSKDTASQSTSGTYYGTRGIFCMWAERTGVCTGVCAGVAQTVLYFSKLCMTSLTTLPHTIYQRSDSIGSSDLLGLEWSGFENKSTPVQITLGLASS